jgi:hypothetical protein
MLGALLIARKNKEKKKKAIERRGQWRFAASIVGPSELAQSSSCPLALSGSVADLAVSPVLSPGMSSRGRGPGRRPLTSAKAPTGGPPALLLPLLLLLLWCATAAVGVGATALEWEVRGVDGVWTPSSLTVVSGDLVRWTWSGAANVRSDDVAPVNPEAPEETPSFPFRRFGLTFPLSSSLFALACSRHLTCRPLSRVRVQWRCSIGFVLYSDSELSAV